MLKRGASLSLLCCERVVRFRCYAVKGWFGFVVMLWKGGSFSLFMLWKDGSFSLLCCERDGSFSLLFCERDGSFSLLCCERMVRFRCFAVKGWFVFVATLRNLKRGRERKKKDGIQHFWYPHDLRVFFISDRDCLTIVFTFNTDIHVPQPRFRSRSFWWYRHMNVQRHSISLHRQRN